MVLSKVRERERLLYCPHKSYIYHSDGLVDYMRSIARSYGRQLIQSTSSSLPRRPSMPHSTLLVWKPKQNLVANNARSLYSESRCSSRLGFQISLPNGIYAFPLLSRFYPCTVVSAVMEKARFGLAGPRGLSKISTGHRSVLSDP